MVRSFDRFPSASVGSPSVSASTVPTVHSVEANNNNAQLEQKKKKKKQKIKLSLGEDENTERGNWSGKLDFILSSIGLAVGLGNVWRFPYLCYENGGGAFLIPYTIMLAFAGLPLLYFELALGQFASEGPLSIWKISPMFKGVGYAMLIVTSLCSIYYNVIIAYVIFYFFASLTSELPWKDCSHTWNSASCTSFGEIFFSLQILQVIWIPINANCPECRDMYMHSVTENEYTVMASNVSKLKSSAEDYWERYVLDLSPSIEQPGNIRWSLALCLLLGWVIVFLCLIKGIKSTGKVVYFTALFPYFVLFILLIRGATLPGSMRGIKYYIIPDFDKLGSAQVWGRAAIQIFYSLGPAWGSMLTMSSYNRFHNNCYRDAIIIAVVNCGTSILAGFVIFSVLGFMSTEYNIPVDKVTDSGPGLAFVAYPAGLSMMPGAPFWSAVFFFMLFTLGLDSQFAFIECIVSAFSDEYPRKLRPHKILFTLCVCVLFFLLGLPQVTQGGIYWMKLLDWYAVGFSLLVIGLFEICVVMYVYGYGRFSNDVQSMIGFPPNWYWLICWVGITPLSIVAIIVFYAILQEPITYNDQKYPAWASTLGWLTVALALMWIPLWAVFKAWLCNPSVFAEMLNPTSDWGPALEQHRLHRKKLDEEMTDEKEIRPHDITIDSIDFRVPYGMMNAYANSAYSSRSDLTFYESHV
ncbi:hypothetical protein CAPTEDRAFT_93564 [Capitella teleta]|uniref:Transporter n=1 Tax=Capitella teleta TaxID=283909 RepID=R7UCJ3_CAPTE|nr:hypothetical protein CAPTEDRAFT_93564 [Capitella teleta]|eukprot:ELU04100.1 hypothetical protein CAPTEDRAFT_93564 [Capitella teleta]